MNYQDYAIKVLRESGYRMTQPRKLVMDLLARANRAMNAYDIAREAGAAMDVSTAYRILEVFSELKLVHFVKELQGYMACRDFKCSNSKHCHHQFVCKSCEGVREVHVDDHDMIEALKNKMQGFEIDDHYLEFSGTCNKCLTKKI